MTGDPMRFDPVRILRFLRAVFVFGLAVVTGALAGAVAWSLAHVVQSFVFGAVLVAILVIRPHGSIVASLAVIFALWRLWSIYRDRNRDRNR